MKIKILIKKFDQNCREFLAAVFNRFITS